MDIKAAHLDGYQIFFQFYVGGAINQPPVGTDYSTLCNTDPKCDQDARPYNTKFPFLSNIFQMGNVYRSNYDALQATLNARNFHGLSMVAGYTYGHSLDAVGANTLTT